MKRYDVFISYRRAGGEDFARAVYQELCHRKYKVFLDRQNLESGDYEQQVFEVISNCRDAVIILPQNALDRCCDEKDLFRKEIAAALEQQKNLIPIVRSGFTFPGEETLPLDIRGLIKQEAIIETPESYDAVIRRLTEMLDKSERIYKRNRFRKIAKRTAKVAVVIAIISGIIAGAAYGIVKKINSSEERSATQYSEIDRSNNNHEPVIVEPGIYAMCHMDDNGHLQEIFLGQAISEMYEIFEKDNSGGPGSDRYEEGTLKYIICLTGDAKSFSYNEKQVQLGDYNEGIEDEEPLPYSAQVTFLIEKGKIINIHYALAVENESQAIELMDSLFDSYDNGSGIKDIKNKKYTISFVSALNGDLELSYGTNSNGTMLFMYDVSNGIDIPSYLSKTTAKATEEAVLPNIDIEPYENKTYNCHFYSDEVSASFSISNIDVVCDKSYSGKYTAEFVLYGEKTYDKNGENRLGSVSAVAQLLDDTGNIVDSTNIYSPDIRTGEKFKDDFSFFNKLESGKNYTIRITEE